MRATTTRNRARCTRPGTRVHFAPLLAAALAAAGGILSRGDSPPENRAQGFSADDRGYWALQPVKPQCPPHVRNHAWCASPLDRFVLTRLEAAGLAPAGQADRRTLIRRLSFDLCGLPPTPDEVEEFVADASPDAYERLVDRLLSSPRHGERWARHWLDLVRYAETDGFKSDNARPSAWRYRDYVVAALNSDKPYDRFVAEQLAGDEIASGDPAALVATGFLRHWPYEDNGRDVFGQRANVLNDLTDVVGQVFLGLTFRCARCHDHKYDPILQRDYYRLQAFFAAAIPCDEQPAAAADVWRLYQQRRTAWEQATAAVRGQIEELEAPVRARMRAEQQQMFPKEVQAVLEKPADRRTPADRVIADLAEKQLTFDAAQVSARMSKEVRQRWGSLRKDLGATAGEPPPEPPTAMAVRDIGPDAPEVLIPGRPEAGAIEPGYLTILDPAPAQVAAPAGGSTGRRTALARWIASPSNPLTARVIVNRLWQHHFGRGIVATSGDFGRQGDPPTHPELLDYLAGDLVRAEWRLKPLHRAMVTTAAYRQASAVAAPAAANDSDPDNKLLWRMRLRRMEAEAIRDAMLCVSGELSLTMGGPSALPDLPKELSERYAWKPSADAAERCRRSVYLVAKRNLTLPLLDAFDAPDTHDVCCVRAVTTTAPQALALLNDDWSAARAAAFARRVRALAGGDLDGRIDTAHRLAYGRPPRADEAALARQFFAQADPSAAHETLVDYCHMLLSASELMYVD